MTERSNEKLWQSIKNKVLSSEVAGTKADQWSARKAQLAVKEYKSKGGGYKSEKDKSNPLTKWSEQNWRTKSGLPSSMTGERYLPYKAIQSLSPYQYKVTTLEKQKAMQLGKQFSKQPEEIANITKKYR
jgi:hypothetical protein